MIFSANEKAQTTDNDYLYTMQKKLATTFIIILFAVNALFSQVKPICILDLTKKNAEATKGNLFSAGHILKSAGFSFSTSDSVNIAIQSNIILSTSNIESNTFNQAERDSLRSFLTRGGIWIATNDKDTLLYDCFGISATSFNSNRFYLNFNTAYDTNIFALFDEPFEKQIQFGDTADYATCIGTRAFTPNTADTLATYETGEVAATHNAFGLGHNYQLGTQLKEVILRPQVKEDYHANRDFSNGFEPAQDVYVFLIAGIIKKHLPNVVYKHTSYCNFKSTLVITHDVDATSSMEMFDDYASYEKVNDISSTYMITTHYNHDKLAKNFFDGFEDDILRVFNMGHDIQSHSVSHMPDFDVETIVPMGSPGNNRYNYMPYFDGATSSNVSVFGEAEVSRDLLGAIINKQVNIFRPGYLAFPNYLINVLDSLHYSYSSSHSANNVMTNFPFFSHTDLEMDGRLTNVLEIPNTISDVLHDDPISQSNYLSKVALWKSSFDKNHSNNLSTVLLIHPTRYYKLHAQQLLIQSLPQSSITTNLEEFGNFWKNRDSLEFTTQTTGDTLFIQLSLKANEINEHVSFVINNGQNFSKIKVVDKDSTLINYTQSNWNANDIIIHNSCERPTYNNYSIAATPSVNNVYVHPNPSDKSGAWLHFELMEESEVTISIYDTKGSIVAEPFISAKYNLGIHDLALPYQTLSKGVYALRVTIGTEVYKLKWILIE